MSQITRRKFLGKTLFGLGGLVLASQSAFSTVASSEGYGIDNTNAESRFYFNNRHFMTLVKTNGILNFRPHPDAGLNDDAWGSSWYAQPFLPGAVLKNTTLNSLTVDASGIHVDAKGKVSRAQSETFGDWFTKLDFAYNERTRRIAGTGSCSITLPNSLSSSTGDLNLFKIASNYLDNVPLLGGRLGDTGDMQRADYVGDSSKGSWIPPLQPGHFPGQTSDNLSILVVGDYYNLDSAAQGYAPINPAYKPNMKIVLKSKIPGIKMIFGAIYDTAKSKDFWEDNVGITPLVLTSDAKKQFDFDVEFESTPYRESAVRDWEKYK